MQIAQQFQSRASRRVAVVLALLGLGGFTAGLLTTSSATADHCRHHHPDHHNSFSTGVTHHDFHLTYASHPFKEPSYDNRWYVTNDEHVC